MSSLLDLLHAILSTDMNSAVLLISCPDKKGIVAAIADFLYTHNANILHADEHKDFEQNLFFLRIEWDLADFSLPLDNFAEAFLRVAERFMMEWKLEIVSKKKHVAIFVSREEHCLADLLYRYKTGELSCEISAVVSNHENAKSFAEFYNIPFFYIPSDNKEEAEKKSLELLKEKNVEVVILARYMQILSPEFTKEYKNKIINIHHSFLPSFIGAKPYLQAYNRGVKLIGATAHFVTEDLDQGPIIEQDTLRVSHQDNSEDLVQKGKDLEKIVLARAVKWFLENKILIYANKTVVFD